MDNDLMIDWVKNVWGKRPGGLRRKSLLVLDAFRCQKSDYIKTLLKEDYRSALTIIPGGMTSILHPLDVIVNKPMKVMLRLRWNDWYCDKRAYFHCIWEHTKADTARCLYLGERCMGRA